jgi:hypothetical protein
MPAKRTMRFLATRSGTNLWCAARTWALVGFQGVGNVRFLWRRPWSVCGLAIANGQKPMLSGKRRFSCAIVHPDRPIARWGSARWVETSSREQGTLDIFRGVVVQLIVRKRQPRRQYQVAWEIPLGAIRVSTSLSYRNDPANTGLHNAGGTGSRTRATRKAEERDGQALEMALCCGSARRPG